MYIKELTKIWNAAKNDAKKNPNHYKQKHPTLWEIGEAKRMKKRLGNIIIFENIPQKGFSKNQPSRCEGCNGEGKLLVATGYFLLSKITGLTAKSRKNGLSARIVTGMGMLFNAGSG